MELVVEVDFAAFPETCISYNMRVLNVTIAETPKKKDKSYRH